MGSQGTEGGRTTDNKEETKPKKEGRKEGRIVGSQGKKEADEGRKK